MRLIIIAILIILAVWILVLGWRNQKRISWFGVFLMLLPAAGLAYLEYEWQKPQDEITLVVQEIVQSNNVSFQCQRFSASFFDAESSIKVVPNSPNVVELKYSPCKALVDWYLAEPGIKDQPDEETIEALHFFSREVMRVAGTTDFKLVECLAVKNTSLIAQKLGATASTANYMSLYYVQNLQEKTFQRNPVFC